MVTKQLGTKELIQDFAVILVGIILVPIINSVTAEANVTGSVRTILSLVPLMFALVLVIRSVRSIT